VSIAIRKGGDDPAS